MTTKIQTFGGNIGIGTTDPGDFKLNVHGSLKTNSLVVNGITNAHLPIGLIAPWYGTVASIPSGWALCNGDTYTRTDGVGDITTPNLRARYIRGATGDAPSTVATGTTGGADNVTLAVANLASHSHGVTVSDKQVPHSHTTTQSSAQHSHGGNSNETNCPHQHGLADTTQANHSHGNSNYANANHTHSTPSTNAGTHTHNTGQINMGHSHNYRDTSLNTFLRAGFISAIGEPSPGYTQYSNMTHSHGNSNYANMNHSHGNCPQSTAPHSHASQETDTPHSHEISETAASHPHPMGSISALHTHTTPSDNANHSHTASSNNTGSGQSFSILNPYHALHYIMKI